jgi:hypothetical protein
MRRKSGDRPDDRHWAFPAAQGEPESFLAVQGSICSLLSCFFATRSIDPLFNVLDEIFLLHE